jgi:hypothetical protein
MPQKCANYSIFISMTRTHLPSRFLVLGGFLPWKEHLVDPAGHGYAQPSAVVLGNAHGPQHLELMDQLGGRADFLVLELPFHVLHVLNRIQMGLFPGQSRTWRGCPLRTYFILFGA